VQQILSQDNDQRFIFDNPSMCEAMSLARPNKAKNDRIQTLEPQVRDYSFQLSHPKKRSISSWLSFRSTLSGHIKSSRADLLKMASPKLDNALGRPIPPFDGPSSDSDQTVVSTIIYRGQNGHLTSHKDSQD
jgi:hypothetical protein